MASSALRSSLRFLVPRRSCVAMGLALKQVSQLQTSPACSFVYSINSMGPILHYSSKSYICDGIEIENSQENIQYYDNLFRQQNKQQNGQWKQYSSDNKMSGKKNNSNKAKLIVNSITKNLTYISTKARKLEIDNKTLKLQNSIDSPLCILFAYMMAKKKHLLKYSQIYTELGFDVLIIEMTPWQLLWPTKGSQLIAADAVNFLYNNQDSFSPIIIHGFSVGGYQWGELMSIMSRDLPKYQPFLNRVKAQIWDSAADISEIPIGLPKSIFPKNQTLQAALRNYAIYHLKTFYQTATVHYARSSNFFHFPILKCPSLFLVSKVDPVGSEKSNWSVKEDMESIGIKTTWQCWEDSPHVMHYLRHPEEYIDLLYKHLRETNVLEDVAQKKDVAKL